jgi:uridylate kinase
MGYSRYSKVLLKISGEALRGELSPGDLGSGSLSSIHSGSNGPFSENSLRLLQLHLATAHHHQVQVALVVGGGNFWRGTFSEAIHRATSDQMGMLATVANGLYIQDYLTHQGILATLFVPENVSGFGQRYHRDSVKYSLNQGHIAILSGGTGSPYFTTDTGAVLRALELECDCVVKATKVKGIYNHDPLQNPDAQFLPRLTFDDVLQNRYAVMDSVAFDLAASHKLPISVFSFYNESGFLQVLENIPDTHTCVQ